MYKITTLTSFIKHFEKEILQVVDSNFYEVISCTKHKDSGIYTTYLKPLPFFLNWKYRIQNWWYNFYQRILSWL